MRIEICGGIASGKTTLVETIGSLNLLPLSENFQSNPFFDKFYGNVDAYAFETEITFLLQHYSLIREHSDSCIAVDFSLALDLAYAIVTLGHADRTAFEAVLNRSMEKLSPPSLIVRLRCDSYTELDRIKTRHRAAEQTISLAYLNDLEVAIDRALCTPWFRDVPTVMLDSKEQDFRPGGAGRALVCGQIQAALNSRKMRTA